MIETLHGQRETVHFRGHTHLKLYINDESEHYPPHWHEEVEILMPLEGQYSAIIGGTTYRLAVGDLLLIMPGVIHDLPLEPSGIRIIFQFDPSLIRSISGIADSLSLMAPACCIRRDEDAETSRRVSEIMQKIRDLYIGSGLMAEIDIYTQILTMLSLIGAKLRNLQLENKPAAYRAHAAAMMDVCSYIQEHSAEPLCLEDTARMAGFSKYHFERIFRNYTNMSFLQYLTATRISHACYLLRDPSVSITQAAYQSGFSSSAAFAKVFRKVTGYSATEYRARHWVGRHGSI